MEKNEGQDFGGMSGGSLRRINVSPAAFFGQSWEIQIDLGKALETRYSQALKRPHLAASIDFPSVLKAEKR